MSITSERKLLFWSDLDDIKRAADRYTEKNPVLRSLATAFLESLQGTGLVGRDPRDWIITKVERAMREQLGKVLASGKRGMVYMGHAECRICGVELGCADFHGYGFTWPEKAEHYILEHDVWTPECNDLYMAACLRRGEP